MSATHDFTRPTWGRNINFMAIEDEGRTLRACGWSTPLVADGDYVILENGPDETTRYQVGARRLPHFGPQDMWFATLTFAPRSAA